MPGNGAWTGLHERIHVMEQTVSQPALYYVRGMDRDRLGQLPKPSEIRQAYAFDISSPVRQ